MKLYSYILTHDTGFAPNPFWGGRGVRVGRLLLVPAWFQLTGLYETSGQLDS